ncbi:MAG: radical SAM protein [Candidatus Micrarchaeota archaeon]|nr:radical SAM protein [Candidatus Micrarchaeota archaeon]
MDDVRRALGRYFSILEGSAEARYLLSKRSRELTKKALLAGRMAESCCFCERRCGANRKAGQAGFCGVGFESRVASAFIHTGEERELVPSGTLFFSGCNFRCCFCQNWDISQFPLSGTVWQASQIADWMEKVRAININFVGGEPTPHLHNILSALCLCKRNIPIIWNSNMYMSGEAMGLLEGAVDVYLSDFKYGNDSCALALSGAPQYFSVVSRNHLLAKRQAELLIRHLVLPSHIECCSKPVLDWIAENLGQDARLNIMSQYHPEYQAFKFPRINRRLSQQEYADVVRHAEKLGLNYEAQPLP